MSDAPECFQFPTLPPIPNIQARTVMVDLPWSYEDDLPGPGRGAASHYSTLHPGTVAGMAPQIQKVTDANCHLYFWTTNRFMAEAFSIVQEWGFTPKTVITWDKVLDAPETLPHERDGEVECPESDVDGIRRDFNLGHYLRNTTEHMVFAAKGNLQTEENDAVTRFFAETREHSAKPAKAYRLAEYLSQGPRLDLFSRRDREGWTAWGDETGELNGGDGGE